jgi:uncharacterized protein YlxP (DUF503 family)
VLHIGILQFSLEIAWSESLKDKRSVVQSVKEQLRRKFNCSVAEIEDQEDATLATLGAVLAGSDIKVLNRALDQLIDVLEDWRDASLVDQQLEIISPR